MSSPRAFFVTGTDTGVGKTFAACSMLEAARRQGMSTAAVKPVAAGVIDSPQGPVNEDVLALSGYCSMSLPVSLINPVCFDEPIAPHIAALGTGRHLDADDLAQACKKVLAKGADFTLIEGAGGWKVPLNDTETLADLATLLSIPVVLVVGMRLGCLNHALLTARAIEDDGLQLAGWIANEPGPRMDCYQENLTTLEKLLKAPLIGEIPFGQQPEDIAGSLAMDLLFSRD